MGQHMSLDSEDYFKNQNINKLKDQLIQQVKYEYTLFMKKYLVMLDMENDEFRFRELRIKPRYVEDYLMKHPSHRKYV